MNLEQILQAPDFSVDEINIGDKLDQIPFSERNDYLSKILSKLNPSGEITISGTDMVVLTKLISTNVMDIPSANSILENIKSMNTLNEMERLMYNSNFKITRKNIEGYGRYVFTARHSM